MLKFRDMAGDKELGSGPWFELLSSSTRRVHDEHAAHPPLVGAHGLSIIGTQYAQELDEACLPLCSVQGVVCEEGMPPGTYGVGRNAPAAPWSG